MKKNLTATGHPLTADQRGLLDFLQTPDAPLVIDAALLNFAIHVEHFIRHPLDAEQSDFQSFFYTIQFIRLAIMAAASKES